MDIRNYNYKNCTSKNNEFSAKINPKLNNKLTSYCKVKNINKTHFVNEVVSKALDALQRAFKSRIG